MGPRTTDAEIATGTLAGGRRVVVVALGARDEGREGAAQALAALERAIAGAPDLARSAARSGPALALAAFVAAQRAGTGSGADSGAGSGPGPPAFALSIGDAVRRGVPTAARATITAPAPLRHGLAEAQFGGSFGAAFARVADLLLVFGRAEEPVAIEIRQDGTVRVVPARSVLGEGHAACPTRERARALSAHGAGAHVLTTGPGADAGLPFANLASFDADDLDGAPSIVGRGGLGATVAAAGVVALVVEGAAADDAASTPATDALRTLLTNSPRLLARSVGGTLELGAQREGEVDVGTGDREKRGCRGCPTPCGWRFDVKVRGGGSRVSGRFAALQGFVGKGDVLALVERCNDLGIDARSAAALYGAGRRALDPAEFLAGIVVPGSALHAEALAVGATPGVEPEPGATFATADLAARVGQALAVRGPEPVRSLSVFGLAGVEPAALVAPLPWTGERDADAGTLAYWHECFAAAIDITGFCAFSAAALIADGLADVAALARVLRPSASESSGWGVEESTGQALLSAGAEHIALHRELAGPAKDVRCVQIERELPDAVAAYRRAVLRGFRGESSAHASVVAEPSSLAPSGAPHGTSTQASDGVIKVRTTGLLAARLKHCPGRCDARPGASADDGFVVIEVAAPAAGLAPLELLKALARAHPPAARWLIDAQGRPVPAVVAADARVSARETIPPGSVAELVLAIPGG